VTPETKYIVLSYTVRRSFDILNRLGVAHEWRTDGRTGSLQQ